MVFDEGLALCLSGVDFEYIFSPSPSSPTLKGKVQSRSLRSLALHLASGVPEVGAFGSEER
jgi:hypothetical protein